MMLAALSYGEGPSIALIMRVTEIRPGKGQLIASPLSTNGN